MAAINGKRPSYEKLLILESNSEDEGTDNITEWETTPLSSEHSPAVEIHESDQFTSVPHSTKGRRRTKFCKPTTCALVFAFSLLSLGVGYLAGFFTPYHAPKPAEPARRTWRTKFSDYGTESCVRLLDADGDGLNDVIIGLALGKDVSFMLTESIMDQFCADQGMKTPCAGAVVALRGYDGTILWISRTYAEIFELNCHAIDANKDGTTDCIASGRLGDVRVINSKNGETIWEGEESCVNRRWNIYNAAALPDLDYDGVPELVIAHGGDPTIPADDKKRDAGRLLMLSGATGKFIGRHLDMPENGEIYMSPVVHERRDGSQYVLYGSGGESVGGLFLAISVPDLYRYVHDLPKDHLVPNIRGKYDQWGFKRPSPLGQIELFRSDSKGVMVPPVLVDVTKDGVKDVLMNAFDGTMILFDGETLEIVWKAKFEHRESYSTPAPGYFNDDDIIDFMVHWSQGQWPFYNTTDTIVIDGKDGVVLWNFTSYKYDVTSDLVARTSNRNRDVFLFRTQGSIGKDIHNAGAIHGATGIQRVIIRSLHDRGYQEYELVEGGVDPEGVMLPVHHFRDRSAVDNDYIECEIDQAVYLAELFAVDRTVMRNPIKLWEKGSEKFYYKLTAADRKLVDEVIKKYGTNITVGENEVPWARGRRQSLSSSSRPFCVLVQPDERSTGAVGDVDGDGKLDVIINLVSVGVIRDEYAHFVKMKFDVDIFKISLDDMLQQEMYTPINVTVHERMEHVTNENTIKKLLFLPGYKQNWGGYMGTYGDSTYD